MRTRISVALVLALLVPGCLGPSSGPALCPQNEAPGALATPPGLGVGDAGRGAGLFAEHCARCHSHDIGDRGSRVFRRYPRLDCASWLTKTSDAYLFRIVAEGGAAFDRDELMKPFAGELSDREISDLVAYLRSFAP